MNIRELSAEYERLNAEQTALLGLGDEMTAEQLTQAQALDVRLSELDTQIEAATSLDAMRQENERRAARVSTVTRPPLTTSLAPVSLPATAEQVREVGARTNRAFTVPAQTIRSRTVHFGEPETAYAFGQWLLATSRPNERSRQYCRDHGIALVRMDGAGNPMQLAHTEVVNTQGGFLVPPQFESQLIDLRERYGVARRVLRNRPMTSDVLNIPRRTGGLTAYWVSDNTAITESTKSWDMVTLAAKKAGILAKVSSELSEDAIINVADDLAGEMSYAFSLLEDRCAFLGDGTSTYAGMVGLANAFLNLSATRANIAGAVVATGNLFSEIILSDFNAVKAKLPLYAYTQNTSWYVHQSFYAGVMEKLALAAGGVTEMGIANGMPAKFMGYPVVPVQVMPSTDANDQIVAYFGDLSLAAAFGDRRQTTIAVSEHSSFSSDVLDIRATERFDINVHDVGNADSTAANRVPGPVVALLMAAA